jgi:hypothetical protein
MADQPKAGEQATAARQPGLDEITVTAPGGRHLCNSLQHRNAGRLADVMVTFGRLGIRKLDPQALWPECWGRTYPMCGQCWDDARQFAQKRRPGLVIHDHRAPSPPTSPPPGQAEAR